MLAKGRMAAVALSAAMLIGSADALSAQTGPQGSDAAVPQIVAYRKALMNTNAQHLRALRALTSGEIELPDQIRKHAAVLADNGDLMLTQAIAGTHDIFPQGSAHAASRAMDEIWAMPAEFTERVRAFAVAADELNAAAQRGSMDEIRQALDGVQQTCGGCHGEFRKPAAAGS